jgi:glycosyltransferase involved in cell wall biosynthesis
MLALGVDAWNLPGDRRGIGRYVRAILREWDAWAADRVRVTLIVPEWATFVVRERYFRELEGRRYRVVSRRASARIALDAVWFPWNGMSWSTPHPAVATLHDATPFALPGIGDRAGSFRTAAAEAVALLTDSAFSRDELLRHLAVPPERLVAVPLGVGAPRPRDAAADRRAATYGRYVLAVGTNEPRKRVALLAHAAHAAGLRLVIAGAGYDAETYARDSNVSLAGQCSDDDLASLYRSAHVFAYASSYEGFGLPLLEAMTYDVPVVASDLPVFREAAGDAATFVSSDDATGFASAFIRLADPLRRADAIAAGRERVATMTWRRTAEATLSSIAGAVVAQKPSSPSKVIR